MKKNTWKLAILTPVLAIVSFTSIKGQSLTTQIDHTKVNAAFTKGMPLLETNNFKIHASRREAPGLVEIHTRDTDIVYVLEGAATLVTGGKALGTHTIAPDEIRGNAIEAGEVRHIVKGDVVVIPNGVPHWFKEVEGPLLYYVVKVTN
jgi:quercetin dioxygenase-like cupin family protein